MDRTEQCEDLHRLLIERLQENLSQPDCSDKWAAKAIEYLSKFQPETLANLPQMDDAVLRNLPFKTG